MMISTVYYIISSHVFHKCIIFMYAWYESEQNDEKGTRARAVYTALVFEHNDTSLAKTGLL